MPDDPTPEERSAVCRDVFGWTDGVDRRLPPVAEKLIAAVVEERRRVEKLEEEIQSLRTARATWRALFRRERSRAA